MSLSLPAKCQRVGFHSHQTRESKRSPVSREQCWSTQLLGGRTFPSCTWHSKYWEEGGQGCASTFSSQAGKGPGPWQLPKRHQEQRNLARLPLSSWATNWTLVTASLNYLTSATLLRGEVRQNKGSTWRRRILIIFTQRTRKTFFKADLCLTHAGPGLFTVEILRRWRFSILQHCNCFKLLLELFHIAPTRQGTACSGQLNPVRACFYLTLWNIAETWGLTLRRTGKPSSCTPWCKGHPKARFCMPCSHELQPLIFLNTSM